MLEFLKKYKYLIILLLISTLVYFRWFSFSIFKYSDWGFFFKEKLIELLNSSVWISERVLGGIDYTFWKFPVYFLYGLFGYFGFNSNIADVFIVFSPTIFLLPIGGYFLVKKITNSNIAAAVGGVILSFNTYFLINNTQGHNMLNVASAFCIFSTLFFIYALERLRMKYFILTTIFLYISTFYDLRISYITCFVLFLYLLNFLFLKLSRQTVIRIVQYCFFSLVVFILLSCYWFLPQLSSGAFSNNEILSRSLFGDNFWNLSNALTLFHPFWSGGKIVWFQIQSLPLYFWLIPIFAFVGLILNRKNKNIVFFGLLSFLGIFLAKQTGEPFSGVYKWLFDNFPGFNAFREASKFYFIIALGYSVLIGAFIDWLWCHMNKSQWQNITKYGLTILVAGLFLWNAKSVITGEIQTMFTPKNIPQDYLVLKDYILNQPEYFRTLWIPGDSKWGILGNYKPKVSGIYVFGNNWNDILPNKNETSLIQNRIIKAFDWNFAKQLFDISSIKYVIVPLQDTANDDDFFVYYGGDKDPNIRQWYISELDKVKWLEKINIGTKELVIYKNANFRDHIYTTKEQESINKNLAVGKVDYKFVNPTEYKISLKNIQADTYLNFSEAYHQDWSLRAGDFNWFKVLTDKNYFIDNKYHFENDANLNSFLISPEYIKQNFPKESYIENPDGSINMEITLYFKPQSYFYLGVIISGATLLGCFVYLGYDFIGRRRRSNVLEKISNNNKE